jgi:hypothetical protein
VNLLREIQDAAVDGSADLETLLRKCRVLASRLKHEELKKWVAYELDGYPQDVPLPEFRICSGLCFGHFFGRSGSRIENCPIPVSDIPERLRHVLTHNQFREGIGELKTFLENVEEETVRFAWPAETTRLIHHRNLAPGMVLGQGWVAMNRSQIAGILSTVRNRILNFALEIGDSFPEAGEETPGEARIRKEDVNRIFHQQITQNFYNAVANVASGHDIEQTGTVNVQQGDFRTLAAFLREKGVLKEDIQELDTAIKSDPPHPEHQKFGRKVSAWIGKMVTKSAEGAWKVGTDVASKLLVEALKRHYGMPP